MRSHVRGLRVSFLEAGLVRRRRDRRTAASTPPLWRLDVDNEPSLETQDCQTSALRWKGYDGTALMVDRRGSVEGGIVAAAPL